MNDFLSQPIHPFHRDASFFAGSKFVWTALWIPVAFVLTLLFEPTVEWSLIKSSDSRLPSGEASR